VNGREVAYGPQLGDVLHWRYETLDLAPFLKKGVNLIAAEVMNWGADRAFGIVSFRTAFMLQGHSEPECIVNSGSSNGWKVLKNEAIFEREVVWRGGTEIIGGFYAANPTDSIAAAKYPWGWQEMTYDDGDWKKSEALYMKPLTAGASHAWTLQPRTTARQVDEKQPFTRVARSDLKAVAVGAVFGKKPIEVPARSRHKILIDQGEVTLGYPKLQVSGGKNTTIKIKYSEALYNANNQKGNRNDLTGKTIKGISDVYFLDGGKNRVFQPIWFRAFRFIELDITTADEPLVIEDYYNMYSASPIPVVASFETSNPLYAQVWDICWRTLRLCAQDNLMSDIYYETMQYVGDLRPHLMAYTALTGDLTYFRSAMEQFNNSRLPDGNIPSCYPLKATFVHPTYSLIWIDMLHDLMMLNGEKDLLKSYTGEIQEVFDYYETLVNENGLVGKSAYPMFIDWYVPKGGNSVANKEGNSAILTLNYAYTLGKAAEILDYLGQGEKAAFYRTEGRKYAEIVRKLCFDPARGVYLDNPEVEFYDQRASILAVLTGAHSEKENKVLMEKVLDEATAFDSRANLFYYVYLFEAMEKTGVGDFTKELKPWQDIIAAGMKATPEKRIEQNPRSEVHPWTAHPVHFYYSLVAGIRPTSPGFATVRIAPQPGDLKFIKAKYPTPRGMIELDLRFEGKLMGTITLPAGMQGEWVWEGKTVPLKAGETTL
ncbi:family 78 glycoside hydrolase catalytic domain, partial [Persicitalea sp.]|uniref:family 78 glycoside hydrolase catalytic domain n=1 Tax=Persicitalea sp. TaxID=3100273 RepID=UPI003593ADF9